MTRRLAVFKQVDLKRAIKGAKAAGLDIDRVEIDPVGKIVLFTKSESGALLSPLERWKQEHGAL